MTKCVIVAVAFLIWPGGQGKQDGDYVWTLPATIEVLRDVPIRTDDHGAQERGVLYVDRAPQGIPTRIEKATRFQMTRIEDEGECTILLLKETLTVTSCPWLFGFSDHQADVFEVVSGRTK